jgi:hypothetical protein
MFRFGMLVCLFRERRGRLLLEDPALRQQLVALKRRHPRPTLLSFGSSPFASATWRPPPIWSSRLVRSGFARILNINIYVRCTSTRATVVNVHNAFVIERSRRAPPTGIVVAVASGHKD